VPQKHRTVRLSSLKPLPSGFRTHIILYIGPRRHCEFWVHSLVFSIALSSFYFFSHLKMCDQILCACYVIPLYCDVLEFGQWKLNHVVHQHRAFIICAIGPSSYIDSITGWRIRVNISKKKKRNRKCVSCVCFICFPSDKRTAARFDYANGVSCTVRTTVNTLFILPFLTPIPE
jgi:hypothetical protein